MPLPRRGHQSHSQTAGRFLALAQESRGADLGNPHDQSRQRGPFKLEAADAGVPQVRCASPMCVTFVNMETTMWRDKRRLAHLWSDGGRQFFIEGVIGFAITWTLLSTIAAWEHLR